MENYQMNMLKAYSTMVSEYNKLQLQDHSKDSIAKGNALVSQGNKLLNIMKNHVQSLETLLSDCKYFVEEVEEDLSYPAPNDDYVYKTAYGMLSYKGRDYTPSKKKKIIKQPKEEQIRHLIKPINYYFHAKKVKKLKDITPMFYYYDNPNDKTYTPGLYCCVSPTIYVKVPFPEIIDSTKEYSRVRSIRCKYNSKSICDEKRSMMASRHRSNIRTCNFAHTGENIIKIGYPSRCASIPRFGNPSTLVKDIKLVNFTDIKNILMYGLSDILSASIWFDYNKITKRVLPDIDKA